MKYVSLQTLKKIATNTFIFTIALVSTLLGNSLTASAYTVYDQRDAIRQTPFFNFEEVPASCSIAPPTAEIGGGESSGDEATGDNKDYAGRPVFTQAELDSINANKSVYEEAAGDALPWQMIAVAHMRETRLARANPGNGQGIFQFADMHGGPYPAGPVDDAEFLRQAKLAAEFLVGKLASNYSANRTLGKTPTTAAVKDTFFSYNGRAGVYATQAGQLGFDPLTEGYEGSPYVMNKADAKRDPGEAAPNTWGQIKRDYGPIEYPANADYGAYVQYAAMAGISTSGTAACNTNANPIHCTNETEAPGESNVRRNAVCLAQKELALWQSGELSPAAGSHTKYTQGRHEDWCADFVSWIYNQVGYPLEPAPFPEGSVPAVAGIQAIGEKGQKFFYHGLGNGYTPVPGDMVILAGTHVNMVINVDGNNITIIGGNQGGTDGPNYYATSSVTTYPMVYGQQMTGFVSPDNGGGTGGGLQPI